MTSCRVIQSEIGLASTQGMKRIMTPANLSAAQGQGDETAWGGPEAGTEVGLEALPLSGSGVFRFLARLRV